MKDDKGIKGSGGFRVEIGTELVSRDGAVTCPLNSDHALRRNTVVYPFGDRLWRYTNSPREGGLGTDGAERSLKDFTAHDCDALIHSQFMSVNDTVIAHKPHVYDSSGMDKRIPQPENYANFAAWVRAAADYVGSQAALARAVGVSPQMVTKYLNGKTAEPENLEKFADWSGVAYAKLRMLMDGKPVSEAKAIRDRINQTATPLGAQIGRQWEQIQDERTRNLIAEQIRLAIEQQAKLEMAARKRGAG
jgi:transcriptional regulator with XRE-family HTH domain